MQGFPYWLDIDRPVFPALDKDRTADAVVIGAGIAGLKLARCLARYGFEVAVLEGARVGEGASSRNQGTIVRLKGVAQVPEVDNLAETILMRNLLEQESSAPG